MLFLRSWLEDYLDLSGYSNTDLVKLITQKSTEVEEVVEINDYFGGKVLIGRIINSRPHPQADRLKVFDVDLGKVGKIQIVSAAPNVADDLLVPVAIEGCRLPFLTIAPRKMRGETSAGMCLGKSELMLETEPSSGLWELNYLLETKISEGKHSQFKQLEDFLGQSICTVFPEFFPVESLFDIKILPDKIGTIGNHIGLAIDLAICAGNLDLLKPTARRFINPEYDIVTEIQNYVTVDSTIQISFGDNTGYANHFWLFDLQISQDTTQSSYYLPCRLVKRMFLTGRHLVGGLADLSNYLLADTGQPTHFFSQKKTLTSNRDKWQIKQLDQATQFRGLGQLKNITVPSGVHVLCDGTGRHLAIPAISGSEESKTDPEDKAVLLEVANFEATQVARNAFVLKQRSEGAKVWAGKVRPIQILAFLLRLIEILRAQTTIQFTLRPIFCWSKADGSQVFVVAARKLQNEANHRVVPVDLQFIIGRLDHRGSAYWQKIVESKLHLLGKYTSKPASLESNHQDTTETLQPHPYYSEINDKYDLLLEVSRLIGFDQFQEHNLHTTIKNVHTPLFATLDKLRQIVRSFGFDEVITRPFVGKDWVFDPHTSLTVTKPYRSQEPYLRDRLIYTLAQCLVDNLQRGEKEPRIFELNQIYRFDSRLQERLFLAGLTLSPDPYLLTSLGKAVLAKASVPDPQIQDLDEPLRRLGKGVLYQTGILDYRILELGNAFKKQFNLPTSKTLWYFEFDLTNWHLKLQTHPFYQDESLYPAITRDYSLKVPTDLTWQTVAKVAQSIPIPDTRLSLHPTERWSSTPGEDVLNFQVKFVNYHRTLRSQEVIGWQDQFISALQKLGPVVQR